MKWFASQMCSRLMACHDCRRSRAFRESLFKAGRVESADFTCPKGFTNYDLPKTSLPPQKKVGKCCGQ